MHAHAANQGFDLKCTVRSDDLPHPLQWSAFLVNLLELSKSSILSYEIRKDVKPLEVEIKLNIPKSKSPAEIHHKWRPSRSAQYKLLAFGFSHKAVLVLVDQFIRDEPEATDEKFIQYAVRKSKTLQSKLIVPLCWMPSVTTKNALLDQQMPLHAIENYLHQFKGGVCNHPDWDRAFYDFALSHWQKDSTNKNQNLKNPMAANWEPSPAILSALAKETGGKIEQLNLMFLEYRLYWQEKGESRSNWDSHFLNWAKRQDLSIFKPHSLEKPTF